MIRLALPNSPYIVPETGLPVEGRMKVFLHDSGEHTPLYTLEGDEYVEAANPQLLHAGLPFATLFTPLGVFDVVIEKYIGVPGEMSVYSPDSDFEQIGVYRTGMDFDIASFSRNTVDTLDELRDVDPALKMVTVKWYATEGDCVPRTYIWDAASENAEDGGYVIGSDVSDTGKWILMWDDDVLPCSVYGVKPGSEVNITLLLSYPSKIGSFQMATAPRVRFTRGTYTTNNNWSTSKELLFDPGASFTLGSFVCPKIQVLGTRDSWVSQFSFTAADAVAHSSWFKTLNAFWHCGAKKLVIDDTNYFTSSALTSSVEIVEAVIEGSKRMSATYSTGKYIKLTRCTLNASRIFNPSDDYVEFVGMRWDNKIWTTATVSSYDFGKISDGHHVEFTRASSNIVLLADFENAEVYLAVLDAMLRDTTYSDTDVNLDGRTISSFSWTRFTKLRNCTVTGNLTLVANMTLDHVKVLGNTIGGSSSMIIEDCSLKFASEPADGTSVTASKSSISSSVTWTGNHKMTIGDCDIAIPINNADDNETLKSKISIYDSRLTSGTASIRTNHLSIRDSYLQSQNITIYPYKSGADYKIFLDLCGNVIDNTRNIHFTRHDTVGGEEDMNCKEIKLEVTVIGNDFVGTGNLQMDFWAEPTRRSLFLDMGVSSHAYVYEGNTGSAPLEKWTGYESSMTNTYETVYGKDGTTPAQYYVHPIGRVSPGFGKVALFPNGNYSSWIKYAWFETFSYAALGAEAALDDTVKGDWYDCMFVSTTDVTGPVRVV